MPAVAGVLSRQDRVESVGGLVGFGPKNGYPRFLNLGAEGTRGFQQMPLAAAAAPIQESVLPIETVGRHALHDYGEFPTSEIPGTSSKRRSRRRPGCPAKQHTEEEFRLWRRRVRP